MELSCKELLLEPPAPSPHVELLLAMPRPKAGALGTGRGVGMLTFPCGQPIAIVGEELMGTHWKMNTNDSITKKRETLGLPSESMTRQL